MAKWFLPVPDIAKLSQEEAERAVPLPIGTLYDRVNDMEQRIKPKSKRIPKIMSHIEDNLVEVVADCKDRVNRIIEMSIEQDLME